MHEHIYKYLALYKKLSIPKLGNFTIKDEPAYVDADMGQLFPPKPVLVFEAGEAAASDRFFFDFLAEEMGVDDVTAIQAYSDFSDRLRQEIWEQDTTVLQGLGSFSKVANDQLVFMADTTVLDLLPSIPLEKEVISLGAPEKPANDYWWFYAIILLLLGLGALAYYYA